LMRINPTQVWNIGILIMPLVQQIEGDFCHS
jgi:hypothetical protein